MAFPWMNKIYFPASISSSCRFQLACVIVTLIHLCLLSNLTFADVFESPMQLRPSGSMKYRSRSKRILYVEDYGAKGDGLHDDTKAFRDTWNVACSLTKGATIVIRGGSTHLVHRTNFIGPCRSRMTLRIYGIIIAPKSPDAWKGLNPRKWIYFMGVNHLALDGGGTINGMGQEWWHRSCKLNKTNPCKHAPTAIMFHRCNNLKIKNLMVKNSQQMHVEFTDCAGVTASHLKVIAPAFSPNTDGIHISASTHVQVMDSIIRTGDDCISIVSNSSRIKITNIACGPGHGISIGSLGKSHSWAQVHDVVVDGAYLSNTENGVRIKTWQGGHGFVSNIIFQNVFMENVSNPIIIDQYYCDSVFPCTNQTSAVKVEGITFKRVEGTSATDEAVRFACSDTYPCERILLEDVVLVSSSPGGICTCFCWEAHGSSHGVIDPPPCFSSPQSIIHQKTQKFRSVSQSITGWSANAYKLID